MEIGKSLIRLTTTILFIITMFIFVGAVVISTMRTNGLTSWELESTEILVLLGSFAVLTAVNIFRLMLGVNLVMTKKNVQYQPILLIFFSLLFLSLCFLTIHAFEIAAILFVTAGAGTAIIKQSMWTIFTDIRESDHMLFKNRLIKMGILMGALALLGIFGMSNNSFTDNIIYPIYFGYLLASFFIGYTAVKPYFAPALVAVSDWIDAEEKNVAGVNKRQAENAAIHRAQTGMTPPSIVGPKGDMGLSTGVGLLILLSMCIAGFAVGVFLIPFYIYVLVTKRVTVVEPAVA